jgi:hypothetical protein
MIGHFGSSPFVIGEEAASIDALVQCSKKP